MKILLVDDHPVVICAIENLLTSEGLEIVGTAKNGVAAIDLTRELQPDLLILDIDIPQLDGLSVLSRLASMASKPKILIYTGTKNTQMAARCLSAGAAGYVNKEGDMAELLTACKALLSGYSWFKADALESVRENDFKFNEADLVGTLSPREINVLRCLARGDSNIRIAKDLHISEKTVSTYKSRLLQKLGVSSVVHLAEFAKRNGLA